MECGEDHLLGGKRLAHFELAHPLSELRPNSVHMPSEFVVSACRPNSVPNTAIRAFTAG